MAELVPEKSVSIDTLPARLKGSVLTNLQGLRALAVVSVLVFHARDTVFFLGHRSILNGLEVGQAGVDIFFVLSGFMMVLISENRSRSALSFIGERFIRIAPLYWFTTVLVYLIAYISPGFLRATHQDMFQLVKSLGFIAFEKRPGLVHPVAFVGWTLNYEMFFYMAFASAMLFGRLHYVVLFTIILVCVAVGYFLKPHGAVAKFYSDPIMCEFLLGVCIGLVRPRSVKAGNVWVAAVYLATAFMLAVSIVFLYENMTQARLIAFGVPAAAIIWLVARAEANGTRLRKGIITLIGDASYSIYLTHFFVTQAGTKVWAHFAAHLPWEVSLIAYLGVISTAILVGIGVCNFVELPMRNFLKRAMKGLSHKKYSLRLAADPRPIHLTRSESNRPRDAC